MVVMATLGCGLLPQFQCPEGIRRIATCYLSEIANMYGVDLSFQCPEGH